MRNEKLSKTKKILLYGYGAEGHSTEKFLNNLFAQKNQKTCITHAPEIIIFDEKILEFSRVPDWNEFDAIFVSPGIPRERIPKTFLPRTTSQIEYFFSNLSSEKFKKIIGITGSKGKSTTAKFCADFLENAGFRVKIGGNFGTPFLDLFEDLEQNKLDFIVAELSSFQLEFLQKSPHIAIFVSFFPDHLDRHKTLENYFQAKSNIFRHQKPTDFLVIPDTWGHLLLAQNIPGRFVLSTKLSKNVFPIDSIFNSDHFLNNFGTIWSLAQILKIPNTEEIFKKTAESFKGLPHRLEFFAEKQNIKFYDDSIAVNPDSAAAAVKTFGKNLGVIILGGQFHGENFDRFLEVFEKNAPTAKIILCQSETAEAIKKSGFQRKFPKEKFIEVTDLAQAVEQAFLACPRGKVCVLSPAGKSFDRFKNYIERGNFFKQLVKEYLVSPRGIEPRSQP